MLRGPLLVLSLTTLAHGQCGVQSVVTQAMGAPPCWVLVATAMGASLQPPCGLQIQATAISYYAGLPTYAILVLGDAPTNVPMPMPFVTGCTLLTNAVAVLWQPYVGTRATFSFAIPPLVLPLSLYAQVVTVIQYPGSCPRGCSADYLIASDGLQITLQ